MRIKRFLAGITSLALSVGMFCAMPLGMNKVYADEIVSDDFEINYDGWYGDGEDTFLSAVENQGHNATRGMKVTNRSCERDGAYSQKGLYLDGGKDYNYSVFVKHEGTNVETFKLSLHYLDAQTQETNSEVIVSKDAAGGDWVELSTKYKAPDTALDITLSITTDSTSDFVFDDVTITQNRKIKTNTASAANGNRGLKDVYANYFRVGSVLNSGTVNNSTITAMILKEFNSITHENELKPDATLVQSGSTNTDIKVSLNRAASILNFCAQNNIAVRGHTLVWHGQTPQWFFKDNFQDHGNWASQSVMDQRMESYIKNMFAEIQRQYPSLNLYAYDVVNEAISDDANRTRNFGGAREPGYGSGKSPWVQIYGDNKFIEKAFVYARRHAPANCKLYYNDYNEYWDHKRDSMAALCTSLYNKGLLDGVGMQSHINSDMNGFTGIQTYTTALQKYINIGCDVQITELDISTENGKFSAQQQADKYKAIFQEAININKNSNKGKVTAICVWGPNDANTWIGSENAPLLFDRNTQPKPAYHALASLVPESEWGDGNNPIDGGGSAKPEEPDANGYYYHDTFEGSIGQWANRGSAEILLSGRVSHKGTEALLIMDREDAWNGAQRALNPATYVPGNKYCFSCFAMFIEGSDAATFCMKLQYVDSRGDTQYDTIDMKTAAANEWVHLYNPEYRIPADARDMYIYIETEEGTMNFYIDEAIGAVAGTTIAGAPAKGATIDLSAEKQLIRGFGGINHPVWIGDLTETQRNTAFGNGEGQLGFSILRIHVDENRNNWSKELPTAKRAAELGALVFASPWNPPNDMIETFTRNGVPNQKRLRYDKYDAYAEHLNDFVAYMKSNGVDLYAISIQNEPDYAHDWTWWTPQEVLRFMKENAGNINCRIMAPESFQYLKNISDPILNDPQALANLDILGAHFYGTNVRDMSYPLFEQKGAGKELWMTEVYVPNSDDNSADRWPEALEVAYNMHNAMVEGNFQAYVWWYIRRQYGPMKEDGTISKRGYMMAHFSKFIRPGYVRVDATKNPADNVHLSAYKKNEDVVVVALNRSYESKTVDISVPKTNIEKWERYTTTASKNLRKEEDVHMVGGVFQVTLEPQSVVTFVATKEDDTKGLGDVNGDGQIDSMDITSIKRHLLNQAPLTGQNLSNADVNGDGSVDTIDLVLIKQYVLGRITIFPR